MKKLAYCILFLCFSYATQAQQFYFAYLQTDNKQSFYVKINDKLLSSSNSGYLVIPKLVNGNYAVTVGFAKDKWPQQQFNLHVNNADEGYIIKNFGAQGWGLYNIQTMAVAMNGQPAKKIVTNDDDAFATQLQGATNAKPAEVFTAAKPTAVSNKGIVKLNDVSNIYGRFISYTIANKAGVDTVDVNIDTQADLANEQSRQTKPKEVQPIAEAKPKPEKFLDIDMKPDGQSATNTTNRNVPIPTVPVTENKKPFVENDKPIVNFNSDCKSIATDDDFYKARKKLAMEDNDDAMVDVAKKLFKQKCYTVAQVKNLSLIFIGDNGKYKLFDAAYAFIADSNNFPSLQQELKDGYYINRFKAMLRN